MANWSYKCDPAKTNFKWQIKERSKVLEECNWNFRINDLKTSNDWPFFFTYGTTTFTGLSGQTLKAVSFLTLLTVLFLGEVLLPGSALSANCSNRYVLVITLAGTSVIPMVDKTEKNKIK